MSIKKQVRARLSLKRGLQISALLAIVILIIGTFIVYFGQGIPRSYWNRFTLARVDFDSHGIPTIEAADWLHIIEAQGFVVAGDRLWQMDLMRRKAAGRLSEWFGAKAVEVDKAARLEDREGVADQAVALLPNIERKQCEAFARGVNRFIAEFKWRWGLEYIVLSQAPQPWRCRDSLLITMSMAEVLSSNAEREAQQFVWRKALSPAWERFLFTEHHPWNKPLFGKPRAGEFAFPPANEYLPKTPIEKPATASFMGDSPAVGSNNWAWGGRTGFLLANDPHLGYSVPGIWYAARLRQSASSWVVGVSIPGIPGIVLGMNPYLAWSFTNVGEDVDDYLKETVREDDGTYLARVINGQPVYAPLIKKEMEIQVRDGEPVRFTALFTHRGPVSKRKNLNDDWYSRQWLPLHPDRLRISTQALAVATNWDEFNAAVDQFLAPAQNIIMIDRAGNIGYRASGTGIKRRVSGRIPQDALLGEWLGFEEAATRPRLLLKANPHGPPNMLATANSRVWVDDFGHNFFSDDRYDRIMGLLEKRVDMSVDDMSAMQNDCVGRFRKELAHWVGNHAKLKEAKAIRLIKTWLAWNGDSRANPLVFAQVDFAELTLLNLLLSRVAKNVFPAGEAALPYLWDLRRGWLVELLQRPDGMKIFGLGDTDVANYLVEQVLTHGQFVPHQEANHWVVRHPFVDRVPLAGLFWGVPEHPQYGAFDLIKAEKPEFGPSVRLVWDMLYPERSTWLLPVGQSGHPACGAYRNFIERWVKNDPLPVLNTPHVWTRPVRPRNVTSASCSTSSGATPRLFEQCQTDKQTRQRNGANY